MKIEKKEPSTKVKQLAYQLLIQALTDIKTEEPKKRRLKAAGRSAYEKNVVA